MEGVRRLAFSPAEHPFDRWVRAQRSLDPIVLSERTITREFRAISHAFVRSVVLPHLGYVPFVQRGAYVRVHSGSETPFHSDALLGHGLDEENLWIPLTTARLYLAPLDCELARCRAEAVPFDLEPGEALLFTAQHIHGVMQADQITVDFRITPRINEHAILGCPFEPLAG